MANTSSAKKAIRSSAKKRVFNLRRLRAYKEAIRNVQKAVAEGDKKEANKLMPAAQKAIDKAVKTDLLKKNTAARYKSRLAAKISQLK